MKHWIVEYSHPVYGGRAYATETVQAEFEGDARVWIMQQRMGAIPIHCYESKQKDYSAAPLAGRVKKNRK